MFQILHRNNPLLLRVSVSGSRDSLAELCSPLQAELRTASKNTKKKRLGKKDKGKWSVIVINLKLLLS